MNFSRALVCTAVLCTLPVLPAFAQDPPASTVTEGASEQPTAPPIGTVPVDPNPKGIKLFAADFKNFFSKDTAQVMGMMAAASIAVTPWDTYGKNNGFHFSTRNTNPGNTIGKFYIQVAAGAALYGVGEIGGHSKAANVGRDIVRAQLLSQTMVQATKLIVQRERPDGSNNYSFPSGHSASMFATASVLQRHFGWKAGVPAYALGAYVASARMAWNKHHISDVVMGAGFGLAAGRTVTVGVGEAKFQLGVAPTVGGAQVTFTKK